MAANLPSNGTILTQDEYGRGTLPKGAERIYGKPTKHDKIGHFIDSRSGNVETIAYRMPEPKRPAKAGKGGVGDLPDAGDTDAVVVKLRPDVTQKGLAMVGDFRTDALHQALDDASIPTETLIGLLVLALGAKNVTVETGRVYETGDREVIRDRISEGGVLTADHDALHDAASAWRPLVAAVAPNLPVLVSANALSRWYTDRLGLRQWTDFGGRHLDLVARHSPSTARGLVPVLKDNHVEPGSRSSVLVSLGVHRRLKRDVARQRASARQNVEPHRPPEPAAVGGASRASRSTASSGNVVMPVSALRCLPPWMIRSGALRRSAISRLNCRGT